MSAILFYEADRHELTKNVSQPCNMHDTLHVLAHVYQLQITRAEIPQGIPWLD